MAVKNAKSFSHRCAQINTDEKQGLWPNKKSSRSLHFFVALFFAVRICVIFNPAARGNKARHFRRHLDEIGGASALKATVAPGDARRLAAEAVGEKYDLIV